MNILSRLKRLVIGGPQRPSEVSIGSTGGSLVDDYKLAKITIHPSKLPSSLPPYAKKGCKLWTTTNGCSGNDWSINISFIESLIEDNDGSYSGRVGVRVLVPEAKFLLKPGTVFNVGETSLRRDITLEVLGV